MNYILFDDCRTNLLPLTFTRPTAYIRTGIDTIKEKWERYLQHTVSMYTEGYLQEKYPLVKQDDNILINGTVIPDQEIINAIQSLSENEALIKDNTIIAARIKENLLGKFRNTNTIIKVEYHNEIIKIENAWDIFSRNGEIIKKDFNEITMNHKSQPIHKSVSVIGSRDQIFIEKGAELKFVTLNTSNGPIYIGKDAEIMENSVIRGPFALCEHATIKMSAKIYGPTTIGPHCKAGGELNNVVMFGYSNKGHDGFLGNSVLGEWCNIGADSNNSNLKNNYANVRLWNYATRRFEDTGLQFCGLIMGDHSKCGINTMFNTGTVIGVNANIFGTGFPRNFIPSFSWGGAAGFSVYQLQKAFEVAGLVMQRRNLKFDNKEKNILKNIFDQTSTYRNF